MEAAAVVSAQLADSFVEDSSAISSSLAGKAEVSADTYHPPDTYQDEEDIGLTSAEQALACQHESELVRLWGQPLPDPHMFIPDGNMPTQQNSEGPPDALLSATMNVARGLIASANSTTCSMSLLRNARTVSEAERVVVVQLRRRGDLVESVRYLNGAVINGRRVKASLLGF
jgi:hypothetical protein